MNAAAHKFVSLGIDDLVKNWGLSELGNHLAATLRDMTSKKRKNVEGKRSRNVPDLINRNAYIIESEEMIQTSRKSPRFTSYPSTPPLTLQFSTPPESMTISTDDDPADHHLFGHPIESLVPTLTHERPGNHGRHDQNTSDSVMDDCVVPYNPFNSRMIRSNI